MATALVIGDIHDNVEALRQIVRRTEFGIVILAGDICEFRCSEFYEVFSKLNVPIIFVHGNHDCLPCFERMSQMIEDFYVLKNDILKLEIDNKTLTIAGLGGVFSRKRRDMHHFSPIDITKLVNKILDLGERIDILITHECAKGCSDIIPYTKGTRGGKEALYILHLAANPRVHICGHMHTPWIERFRNCLCLNPGYGFIGLGALLDLDKWTVKMFHVKFKYDFVKEHRIIYTYSWIRNVKRSYYRILRMEANKIGLVK